MFFSAEFSSFAQLLTLEQLARQRVYRSVKDAEATPNTVLVLDLSDSQLNDLETDITKFPNLQALYLQ